MHPLVLGLDLLGTFVFALSGATLGVRKQFDLFGVLVISFAAAVSGGIVRDVLIGATPPAALSGWYYLAVSCLAGLIGFYRGSAVERLRNPVQLFDAIGLGLFAVTGAAKALAFGLGPVGAMLLGMLTGIGGGIVRDVLLSNVPAVFRSDIYAVAALAGASVVVVGDALQLSNTASAAAGAALCFGLRVAAIRYGWHLPTARRRVPTETRDQSDTQGDGR